MIFVCLSDSFFYNIDFFIIFCLIICFFFCLGKNVYKISDKFNYFSEMFGFFFTKNLLYFLIFLFFNCVILLFCFFDKRIFYFNFMQYDDNFTIIIKFFILFFSILIIIFSWFYFETERLYHSIEYYFILLFSIFAMFILLSANNFLSLYLAIELQSLSFYILASFKQYSLFSLEAGLKYFLLGTVSSGFLIFGSSLIYGIIGSLNFIEVNFFIQQFFLYDSLLLFTGFLFFISAILFKLGAAPFHVWLPDVYEGSPTIITIFFSIVPKMVFLSLLIRLCFDFFVVNNFVFNNILVYCIIFSFLIGSFASIYQKKIKRLLAYSGITNIGYLLLGVLGNHNEALSGSIVYLLIYNLIILSVFINLLLLRNYQNFLKIKNIFDFFGILNINLLFCIIFIINLFSLIGLPPLAGFVIKFYIFFNSMSLDFFLLLYVAILASLISASIYLKMIRLTLFNKQIIFLFFTPLNKFFLIFINFFALINIYIFFNSSFLYKIFYNCFFI